MNSNPQNQSASKEDESLVWSGNPSNLLHLPLYLICFLITAGFMTAAILMREQLNQPVLIGLFVAATLPIDVIAVKWVQNRCRRYEITSQRIRISSGVFSRVTEEVELYRVIDYSLLEPASLRLLGLGTVVITTSDNSNPSVTLEAVPNPRSVLDELRRHVETCRDKKRVRLTELE